MNFGSRPDAALTLVTVRQLSSSFRGSRPAVEPVLCSYFRLPGGVSPPCGAPPKGFGGRGTPFSELPAGFGGAFAPGFTVAPGFGGVPVVFGSVEGGVPAATATGGGSAAGGALVLGVTLAGDVPSGSAGAFEPAAAALVVGLAARGASSDAPMMMRTAVPTTTQTPTSTRHKRSATLGLPPTSGNEMREG